MKMFSPTTVPSLLLITISATFATPTQRDSSTTVILASHIKPADGKTLIDFDRTRILAAKQNGKRPGLLSVTNTGVVYTASVGVGSPSTQYTLLVDTGSSNTWIGGGSIKYTPTNTSHDTGHNVSRSYGSGFFSGEEYLDRVTLSSHLVIENQSIGVASQSQGLDPGVDGILGLGPIDLTNDTVSGVDLVPTVADNLYRQGTIPSEVFGAFLQPSTVSNQGELSFGSPDYSKTTSDIGYAPLTSTFPSNQNWGIDMSVTYGKNSTNILNRTPGIVDTGYTLLPFASDAYQAYQQATGAVIDQTTGLLTISNDQYNALEPLDFHIGDHTFSLSANGQLWPRELNYIIGGAQDSIYLIMVDIGAPTGQGLDYALGYTFLQRFYSVYDTSYERVGFATTAFTDAMPN